MPTVSCPGCNQQLDVPFQLLSGLVACPRCGRQFSPAGDFDFFGSVPAEQEEPEPPEPFEPPEPAQPLARRRPAPEPPPIRRSETHCIRCGKRLHNVITCPRCHSELCSELCLKQHLKGCTVGQGCTPQATVIGLAVLAVLVACGGLISVFKGHEPTTKGQPDPPAQRAAAPPAAPRYPWPECAAVVAYLKENAGDAESVQIIKWESRVVTEKDPNRLTGGMVIISLKFRSKNRLGALAVNRGNFYFRPDRPERLSLPPYIAHPSGP